MIIGISGKKQCGKDTVCKIIKAIDIYYNEAREISNKGTLVKFVNKCLAGRLTTLELYRNIRSKWEKHAFADKLKQSLGIILGESPDSFENNKFKMSESAIWNPDTSEFYTNRELLQKFGTEVGRNISPNLWVSALFTSYHWMNNNELHWVITDVRFPAEAEAIKFRGGILIRVNRETEYEDTHISEIALDNYNEFDYIIDNCDVEGTIIKIENIMRDNNLI